MNAEKTIKIQNILKEKYGHECTFQEAKIAGERLLELFEIMERSQQNPA